MSLSIFMYWKWRFQLPFGIFWTAWLLKLVAGVCLGWIFLRYYSGGDTFLFFNEAKSIAALPSSDFFNLLMTSSNYENSSQPRVLFFTKFLSVFTWISGGNYWITSLYLSLLSFLGCCYAAIIFTRLFPKVRALILLSFLFVPTVVFWSSGILKDTLSFGALVMLVAITVQLYRRQKITFTEIIIAGLSAFILFKIKHYLLITYLIFTGVLFFLQFLRSSQLRMKRISVVFLIVVLGLTQFVHPYLNFKRIPLTLYENNSAILKKSDSEDRLNIIIEEPTWKGVLVEIPESMRTGLARPSIFDPTPVWGWVHRIENFILSFCMVFSIILLIKEKPKVDHPLILAGALSILILATLLALSSPNLGTLVRYKNAFMPFLFFMSSVLPFRHLASQTKE